MANENTGSALSSTISLKHISLVLLATQSLAYGLLLPLCRRPDKDGNVFFAPSGVMTIELFKALTALVGLALKHIQERRSILKEHDYLPISATNADETPAESSYKNRSDGSVNISISPVHLERDSTVFTSTLEEKAQEISFGPVNRSEEYLTILKLCWTDLWNANAIRMAIPAVLYVVQNNLQIFSAGYLPPAEFQVFSQMKLITTAFFSVLLLRKKLVLQHWVSIFTLCVGIISVKGADEFFNGSTKASISLPGLWTMGFPAMVGACCCSGLAGVLIEMSLKGKKTCFWASNVQLATFSFLPALLPIILDTISNQKFAPFRYFNKIVWAMIFVNVAGGILVSMVIKYADNILKGFTVSVALILTILISSLFTGLPLTWLQLTGGFIVAASTFAYGQAKVPQR